MQKGIIIAIDGYSSCGKSTLAKSLAKELNYTFVDSGAMFRAITLFALDNDLFQKDELNIQSLVDSLDQITISFNLDKDSIPITVLNGVEVENEIRSPRVSAKVSQIAKIPEVRTKLLLEQRELATLGRIVMDGRDIGSVVFPNAELKLFITATIETRTKRRYKELLEKNIEITPEEVQSNLIERDRIDSTRKIAPLTKADDAILIDNSDITRDEQLKIALNLVSKRLEEVKQL